MTSFHPLLLATFFSAILSGCGSLMASMQSNSIEDDPGERTLAQQVEDETIETKAMVNINAADDAFDDTHLVVVSYNGFVLIAGQVPDERLKKIATDVTRNITGVRRIYNELEIASPSSALTRTSDTWLTAKVKGILLGRDDVEGGRIKVLTEDGVVFLMGLLTQSEADRATEAVSAVGGVQRVVKMFEIIESY